MGFKLAYSLLALNKILHGELDVGCCCLIL